MRASSTPLTHDAKSAGSLTTQNSAAAVWSALRALLATPPRARTSAISRAAASLPTAGGGPGSNASTERTPNGARPATATERGIFDPGASTKTPAAAARRARLDAAEPIGRARREQHQRRLLAEDRADLALAGDLDRGERLAIAAHQQRLVGVGLEDEDRVQGGRQRGVARRLARVGGQRGRRRRVRAKARVDRVERVEGGEPGDRARPVAADAGDLRRRLVDGREPVERGVGTSGERPRAEQRQAEGEAEDAAGRSAHGVIGVGAARRRAGAG